MWFLASSTDNKQCHVFTSHDVIQSATKKKPSVSRFYGLFCILKIIIRVLCGDAVHFRTNYFINLLIKINTKKIVMIHRTNGIKFDNRFLVSFMFCLCIIFFSSSHSEHIELISWGKLFVVMFLIN